MPSLAARLKRFFGLAQKILSPTPPDPGSGTTTEYDRFAKEQADLEQRVAVQVARYRAKSVRLVAVPKAKSHDHHGA
jgi:hypothetical protein